MTETAANQPAPLIESTADPVEWDKVPFDVRCPRCGEDVHGCRRADCPHCGLMLTWAELVPIHELTCVTCGYHLYGLPGGRCPECGDPIDWSAVLRAHHERRLPLFEYRWRRQPVRSFVRTWWMSLWPRRMWRHVALTDPPRIGPLVVFVLATLVGLWVLLTVCEAVSTICSEVYYYTVWSPGTLTPSMLLYRCGIRCLDAWYRLRSPYYAPELISALLWSLTSLGALFIFVVSMHRYRVRPGHVVRIWAYSVPGRLVLLPFAFMLLEIATELSGRIGTIPWVACIKIAFVAHVCWSIHRAYADYARMKHSVAIALCSQAVAILATLVVIGWIDVGLLSEQLRSFGFGAR